VQYPACLPSSTLSNQVLIADSFHEALNKRIH
jgi:hypothetical protein